MLGFKQFLQEKRDFRLEGEQNDFDIKFKIQNKMIPATNTIHKLLKLKQNKNQLYYHVTSPEGLDNLIDIQNSSKSISAMKTDPRRNKKIIQLGVVSHGGVLVELKGKELLGAMYDIFTYPDKQGRRWLEIRSLFQSISLKEKYKEILKEIKLKFDNALYNWQKNNLKQLWKKYGEYTDLKQIPQISANEAENWRLLVTSLIDITINEDLKNVQGKIKRDITTDYIDFVYNHVKKNQKLWKTALRIVSYENAIELLDNDYYDYDETVLNNFEIQKFYVSEEIYAGENEVFDKLAKKAKVPYEFI